MLWHFFLFLVPSFAYFSMADLKHKGRGLCLPTVYQQVQGPNTDSMNHFPLLVSGVLFNFFFFFLGVACPSVLSREEIFATMSELMGKIQLS